MVAVVVLVLFAAGCLNAIRYRRLADRATRSRFVATRHLLAQEAARARMTTVVALVGAFALALLDALG